MCLLRNVDVLRDDLGLVIEIHHVSLDGKGIGGINAAAIVAEVRHSLDESDQCVVCGCYFELA